MKLCKCGAAISTFSKECSNCLKKKLDTTIKRIMAKVECGNKSTFIEKSQPKDEEEIPF